MTLDVLFDGPLRHADHAIAGWMDELGARRNPVSHGILWVFSQLGGRGTILICMTALGIYLARARRTWQPLIRLAVALGLLTITIYAFKIGVGRTAPGAGVDLIGTSAQSFPSGHTANATLMWGLAAWLAIEYRLPRVWVRILLVLAACAATVAGLAMITLTYHWATDTVVGIAAGLLLLRVLHLIFAGRLGDLAGGRGSGARAAVAGRGSGGNARFVRRSTSGAG